MPVGEERPGVDPDAVAVVGLAGRFPGAPDVDAFWENLRDGVESIRRLPEDEMRTAGVDDEQLSDPDWVPAAADLEDTARFDASFFGVHPREARLMDPQHRHFLECAWHALESAAHDPERFDGRIGIFGGVARNTYFLEALRRDPELLDRVGEYEGLIGSEKDFPSTRAAYKLGLRGPAVNVQTACSTSGVALHLACQSLLSGECDLALAGGGRVLVPPGRGYRYREGGILSPDGHCRAFDADARGTVRGSGMAFVALRRLDDALADRDAVQAVIRGTAVNNDGADKVGFTAPAVEGQAAVVAEALAVAGVEADSVGYVEAHGTGTRIGDPIEVAALTRAFRETTRRTGYCALGSVKTNIGHLDAGAAVTGVVKAVLALRHGLVPPSLHFREPNPEIDFEGSPFFVADELREWPLPDRPRRAGVSSFGLGGTNFHAVLEEAPERPAPASAGPSDGAGERPWSLVVVSARTPEALDASTERLADALEELDEERDDASLRDAAWTLQAGRKAFEHRRAVVGRDPSAVAAALEGGPAAEGRAPSDERRTVFLFPGGGSQHVGMGRDLLQHEPVYRRTVDRCLEAMGPEVAGGVRALLGTDRPDGLPADGGSDAGPLPDPDPERPRFALPALLATQVALARLLGSWGVRPAAVAGHSVGEYAAAHLAGVMSLDDAVALVELRGRLFEEMEEGSMAAVPLPPDAVEEEAVEGLSVAAVNRPSACVVSGTPEAVDRLERRLAPRGVECRRLHIDVAAHSSLVEPVLPRFRDFVRDVELRPARLPLLSNVTGTWADADDLSDPEYWVRHLRRTVRFAPALSALFRWSPATLLEVGPGTTLASFARLHPDRTEDHSVVTTMRHPTEEDDDRAVLLRAVASLWTDGVPVDWTALHRGAPPGRVALPGYPFGGDEHWLDVLDPEGKPARPEPEAAEPDASEVDGREPDAPEEEAAAPEAPGASNGAAPPRPLEGLILDQLDTMNRQLELLREPGESDEP